MYGEESFDERFKRVQKEIEDGGRDVRATGTVIKWLVGAAAALIVLSAIAACCCQAFRRRRGRAIAMRMVTAVPVAAPAPAGAHYSPLGPSYPTAGAPYPPAVTTYAPAGAPYPATGGPYPWSGAPNPATGAPNPATGAPNPATGGPYPWSGAPYPTESRGTDGLSTMQYPSAPEAVHTPPPSYDQVTGNKQAPPPF